MNSAENTTETRTANQSSAGRQMRLLVVGVSMGGVCGVRDHGSKLAEAMTAQGHDITTLWHDVTQGPRRLTRELRRHIQEHRPDALILHYSVFAYSWRGVPIGVPRLATRLRRLGLPVVLFAHEFAYPWTARRSRGLVLAATQRLALVPLVTASDAVIVTTDDRVEWMRARRWLPKRPVACAPVFSNIPVAPATGEVQEVPGRVGVFSFGAEGLDAELVTQAVALAADTIPDAHLALIGGPGRDSAAGERWQRAADEAGCPVSFTGIGTEDEISAELSACQVIFHADPAGPTSRKGSLAAALSHGRPVLALNGPRRWNELVDAGAIVLVARDPAFAGRTLGALLTDDERRTSVGARALELAQGQLSPERTAGVVANLVEQRIDAVSQPVRGARRASNRRGDSAHERPLVALVAHDIHDSGGMERACAELIRRSHPKFAFTIIAADLSPELEPLVDGWIRVPIPRRPFPLKFLCFFVRAGLALRRTNADVVHTVGAIVPNRVDVASIHFCHAGHRGATRRLAPSGAPPLRRANTVLSRSLALLAERWSYRPSRLRTFAAVSDGVAAELRAHYPKVPVALTPNGIDVERFRPDPSGRRSMREAQDLRAEERIALFVGGDWDRKGLGLAVEAMAKARADGADVVLWVVGSGDQQHFEAMAEQLGVPEAVTFFGPRADTERFYQAVDIFVLPSAYETFSLVCFEAAACGLPLVIPPLHGAGQLVGNDEAGLIVERDAADIARAIVQLCEDSELRAGLGAEARRRASLFTWDGSAASVTDLYRTLLDERIRR